MASICFSVILIVSPEIWCPSYSISCTPTSVFRGLRDTLASDSTWRACSICCKWVLRELLNMAISSIYTNMFLKHVLSLNSNPSVLIRAEGELLRPKGTQVNHHLLQSGAVKEVMSLLPSETPTCQNTELTSDIVINLGIMWLLCQASPQFEVVGLTWVWSSYWPL